MCVRAHTHAWTCVHAWTHAWTTTLDVHARPCTRKHKHARARHAGNGVGQTRGWVGGLGVALMGWLAVGVKAGSVLERGAQADMLNA